MAAVFAITSEKGGVGKTTVSANLAALLAELGPTLAVDADPQGSLSAAYGIRVDAAQPDLGSVLLGVQTNADPAEAIVATDVDGVDLLPARRASLEEAERQATTAAGGHSFLRVVLREVTDRYQFIVIDTPSNLGRLTLNAVCAADHVIGVYVPQPWSVNGAGVIAGFVADQRRWELTGAAFAGLLKNMDAPRLRLTKAVDEALSQVSADTFNAAIPQRIQIAEAAAVELPVVVADPEGPAADAFRAFRDELLARTGGRAKPKRRRTSRGVRA